MHHLAILGRQPEFGLVELESLVGADAVKTFGRAACTLDRELDINRLGGTQKLGRVIYQGRTHDLNEVIGLEDLPLPRSGTKTTFGLSYYGSGMSQRFVVATGLTLKKRLRKLGSVRFVQPQSGTNLSAAQVKFNALTRAGFELLIASRRGQMIVAVTEQIQDIDWYAVRDYQRPSRSAKVGMLPPKLAQIMINLTSAPMVYDPFCGTGVILQEALLLGRQAAGSDLAPEMVVASRDNMGWLRQRRPDLPAASIAQADASTLTLPDEPLAIVSEGYLGPRLTKSPSGQQLAQLKQDSLELYESCLKNWRPQLPPGSEVVITLPMWRAGGRWHNLDIIDRLSGLGYTLRDFSHAASSELAYHRTNQIVGRQLLILRKN